MGAPRRDGCLPLPAADAHCRADGRTLGRPSAPTPAGGIPDQHWGAAVSVLTLARSSMIWPRRSPGRCSGMTRCASCTSWARRVPSRCHPGMPWRHWWPAPHPPCTPLRWRTTGSSAPSLQARRFRCTDACPGAVEVTNQPAAERLASKTIGTFLVSATPRLINMVRSGVLDISQASITAFSLDDASEAVTRAADQSAPFDRTVITPNRK